jgi:hypothetical protein
VAVERLRCMWRPVCARVIILAESHVWTSLQETRSGVLHPDGEQTDFARFIYCLGGGESQLITPPVVPNVGAS